MVESQAVQVNLPNKGVDFGIQVNLRGLHLMMKSTDTQVEVDVSESSTQTEEVFLPEIEDNKEEATEAAASPEVSPRKDGIYLPTNQEGFRGFEHVRIRQRTPRGNKMRKSTG